MLVAEVIGVVVVTFAIGNRLGKWRERRQFFERPALTAMTLSAEGGLEMVGWRCYRCQTIVQFRPDGPCELCLRDGVAASDIRPVYMPAGRVKWD